MPKIPNRQNDSDKLDDIKTREAIYGIHGIQDKNLATIMQSTSIKNTTSRSLSRQRIFISHPDVVSSSIDLDKSMKCIKKGGPLPSIIPNQQSS